MAADQTIDQLIRWATARPDVHAEILTSTRAVPGARVDAYSDFDVVLVVDAVEPLVRDRSWLTDFGEVLVDYFDDVESDPATGSERVGSVVNYVDGLKIDWTLWSGAGFARLVSRAEPDPEYDAGYRVLVDKSGVTADLPAPTFRSYRPVRPDERTFHRLVGDFLVGVPYVAKSLLREELLPARWVLDVDMRYTYLLPMLEWKVGCDQDWAVRTGQLGKGLRTQLPADVNVQLEQTFADAEHTWDALFGMIALFDRLAQEVAAALGYRSPHDLIARVSVHAHRMRAGDFAAGPLRGRDSGGRSGLRQR